MEFPFDIPKFLPLDHNGFAVLDAHATSLQSRSPSSNSISYNRGQALIGQDSTKNHLTQIIDKMGEASSKVINLFVVS